ncbi:MAG: CCA tRNA nucleotidyltransferase [Pirellulaceae bacterium]
MNNSSHKNPTHEKPTHEEPVLRSSVDEKLLFANQAATESLRVIARLSDEGYVAYLAGGCVRDALLGHTPKDFDVATNATPDSVRELFGKRETLAFGASFGVIAVLPPRDKRNSSSDAVAPTEVATFRSDGEYSDGRHPDSVQFGSAEEDALRRDFTINGMFYDPQAGKVIDFVGGKEDLKSGVLRTIGNPRARFDEDKLRMLRAVRFATTLGLDVHMDTVAAIQQFADEISVVSGERIGTEMRKVLTSPRAADGLQLLQTCRLAKVVLPEIVKADIVLIRRYFDALSIRDVPSVLASLLISQTLTSKDIHPIASRWKLSNEEQRQSMSAIDHASDVVMAKSRLWSEMQPLLINRDIGEIVNVAQAVAVAEGHSVAGVEFAKEALHWPHEKLHPQPLLTGDDLQEHAFPAGPIFSKILSEVRRAQLDGEITTQKQAITLAKRIVDVARES